MSKGDSTVLPMYHLAVALYDASLKETLASDFKTLKDLLTNTTAHDGPVMKGEQQTGSDTLEKWV